MNKAQMMLWLISLLFLISCSVKKGENMQKPQNQKSQFPRAQETIAPGCADLTARVVNMEGDSTKLIYRVIVEKIHGYGMGTRPIAEGTEILVSIDENKIVSNPDLKKKISQKDQLMRMTVQGGEQMMNQAKTQVWQIRKIK
jgi:hypothetical protein